MVNLKKYLNINLTGKSPAFYLKKNINSLNKNTIKSLSDYAKDKTTDVRICLHSSNKDKLQFMINVLSKKKKIFL